MDNELQRPGRRPFTSPGLVDNLTTRYERNKEKVEQKSYFKFLRRNVRKGVKSKLKYLRVMSNNGKIKKNI